MAVSLQKIPSPPTSKLKPSALSRIICLQGAPAVPPWYSRAPVAISIHRALYENRAPDTLMNSINHHLLHSKQCHVNIGSPNFLTRSSAKSQLFYGRNQKQQQQQQCDKKKRQPGLCRVSRPSDSAMVSSGMLMLLPC